MARSRLVLAVVTAALFVACGAPSDEGTSASTTTTQGAGEGWAQLPSPPLSPRGGAVLTTLEDGRLLVVGGDSSPGCHDTPTIQRREEAPDSRASSGGSLVLASAADCAGPDTDTRLRDGAMLDASGRWTKIATAPAPLSQPTRGVEIEGVVYFWALPIFIQAQPEPGAWMSYDVAADSWTRLQDPPLGENPSIGVLRADVQLVAYRTSDEYGETPDFLYDPATDRWAELADDPLPESFDRMMVWTGSGVGLLGRELAALNRPNGPPLQAAAFDLSRETWTALGEGGASHSNVTWEWALPQVVNAPVAGQDPALGSALPPAPSLPASCREVRRPSAADPEDGESAIGDLKLGDWTLRVPPETDWTTTCNPQMAEFALSSAWAFDGVVTFGGYDAVAEPGSFPTDYDFNNDAWIWRPAD